MNFSTKKVNVFKVFRVAASTCVAILIASFMGLLYSSSAGIIAFLSTQDTKKETLRDIRIRCFSYILAVALSFVIFHVCGYNTPAFGLFMFLMVWLSYYLDWASVLSSSAVVSTHFLFEGTHSINLIINELLLLFIGVGTAMVMNLFIANNTKTIKEDMLKIENEFSRTFKEMSHYIMVLDNSKYDYERYEELKNHLEESSQRAIKNMNNEFYSDSNYYIHYMDARKEQLDAILRIIDKMHMLTHVPFNALQLSDFMEKISKNIHCKSQTILLEEDYRLLSEEFDQFPIPQNRNEFENLANTHDILLELEYYLNIKRNFITSLSDKQIERYWNDRSQNVI